jgi:mono/diheme cytochrome c family protein
MSKITILTLFLSVALAFCLWNACKSASSPDSLPDKVSYNFHIRPILSDKCFACHGPDKNQQKAGLRLDIADLAYAPLKETP